MNADHDDTSRSISADDLIYLLRHRFLDVLVLDLQLIESVENSAGRQKIIGAYHLRGLAKQLRTSPNLGSAVYSIITNEGMRSLMTTLGTQAKT